LNTTGHALIAVAAYPHFMVDESNATLADETKRKNFQEKEEGFLETIEEGADHMTCRLIAQSQQLQCLPVTDGDASAVAVCA
jgi:hypothetical protein